MSSESRTIPSRFSTLETDTLAGSSWVRRSCKQVTLDKKFRLTPSRLGQTVVPLTRGTFPAVRVVMGLPLVMLEGLLDITAVTIESSAASFPSSQILLTGFISSLPEGRTIRSFVRLSGSSGVKTMVTPILGSVISSFWSAVTGGSFSLTPRLLTQEIRLTVTLSPPCEMCLL